MLPVDRSPIVGVDEREVPELVALVDVGNAGDGETEHDLTQSRSAHPAPRRARRTARMCEELGIRGRRARRTRAPLPHAPRRGATSSCAASPRAAPCGDTASSRSGEMGQTPDERLIKERLFVGVRAVRLPRRVAGARHPATVVAHSSGSHVNATSRARTSRLRLVSWVWAARSDARASRRAAPRSRVERVDGQAETARVAPHLVERERARDGGSTRCPRRPSPSPRRTSAGSGSRTPAAPGSSRTRLPAQRLRRARGDRLAIELVDLAALGHRRRCGTPARRRDRLRDPARRRCAAADRPRARTSCGLLELRLVRDLGERTRAPPASGREHRARARVDEQAHDVVRGTRSPWSPRSATRAAARRSRGSSRPRRVRLRRRGGARRYAAGSARPSTWSIRKPSTTPSPHEREDRRVGRREHLRVLDAYAGELVDVEEPAVASRSRDRDRRTAPARSRQNAVLVDRRHVVRARSRTISPSPAAARRAELRLATETVGDPSRIDDVVPVGRPLARLHDRREIEVRHTELAEVRHEQRARPRSPKLGPELKPIRAREVGHVSGPGAGARGAGIDGERCPRPRPPRPPRDRRRRRSTPRRSSAVRSDESGAGSRSARANALKTTRNESSRTGSPWGSTACKRVAVEEHPEPAAPVRVPVATRHAPPVGAEPGHVGQAAIAARAGEEGGATEHRMRGAQRDHPAREVEQRLGVAVDAPSRTRRSRCPGSRRCCCHPAMRPNSSPPRSIGTPCDRKSVAMKLRC